MTSQYDLLLWPSTASDHEYTWSWKTPFSRAESTPCVDCSMQGFPVYHQLLEFTQTHVHWVSDAIQPLSSVLPFSSCPQSFPASGSFQMNPLFTSGGQSIRVSASTSVLPMHTQDWSPLGWTGWISLQSNRLSTVFSNCKSFLYSSTLTSMHDYWENHSFD